MSRLALTRHLGRQPYEPVWRAMQDFTDVRDAATPDEIWLVEHDPVFTLGQAGRALDTSADRAAYSWMTPYGLSTPAQWVAMFARRYLHEYGATSEDFGRVAVLARKHAATNPRAWFHGRPITLAEHQASRWIAEPLHLLDCCQETDGGQALVVVAADRARDLAGRSERDQGADLGRDHPAPRLTPCGGDAFVTFTNQMTPHP